MKKQFVVAILAASVLPFAAQAEGLYMGADVGQSYQKVNVNGLGSSTEHEVGGKLLGGYQLNKNFGVEAGYVNFGKTGASATNGIGTASISARTQSGYVAAVGTLPLNDQFSLYGKAGVARNSTKVTDTFNGVSTTDTIGKTTPMLGVGAAYAFTPKISGVVEYDDFGKVANEGGINMRQSMLSAGVRYKF